MGEGSRPNAVVAHTIQRARPAWRWLPRAISLVIAFLLAWTALPWSPETSVQAAPLPAITGLHASGNQILNAAGQPVRLRGVNRTSGEYACIQNWGIFEGQTDNQAIQAMLSWKINAVRVPLNEDCWLDVNTGGINRAYVGAAYRNAVVDYVDRLTAAGIVVVLDLHWAAPGSQKATGQLPMADRDHAPAFWTSVATTFKSNTAVIFDLFNEPYPDNNRDTVAAWQCLRDGSTGAGSCPGVGYEAAGMQELLNAVRATGATNLVMVAGVAYTGVLSRWLQYRPTDTLDPPNLAASVHIYPPGSQCSTVTCWNQQLAPIATQFPIITGETGQQSCAHDRVDTVIDWMEAHGQHYLVWAWWREPCNGSAYYGLITDYATGAPSPGYGQGYKDRLATLTQPVASGFSTSASVLPASVAPGGTVAITALVTGNTATTVVVDVEVHDAAENKVFQRYYETETFAAGQTRSYPVSWPVLATDEPGAYTVQIGIFSPGWATEHTWNSTAARITVTAPAGTSTPPPTSSPTASPTASPTPSRTPTSTPPPVCTPRPNVTVSSRKLGDGRLEVTVSAQTLPTLSTNGLERITFTAIQNGSVTLNGTPVDPGAAILLGNRASTTFIVDRQAPGQATTVAFTARDRCGDWGSFVGGGPTAF